MVAWFLWSRLSVHVDPAVQRTREYLELHYCLRFRGRTMRIKEGTRRLRLCALARLERLSTPQLSTEATAGSPERDVFFAGPGEVFDGVYEIQLGTQEEQKAVRAAKLHEKKQRKWSRWASKTIPELLRPYMTLVKETDHFVRETSPLSLPACTCQNRSEWKVVGVYFKGASYGNL